MAMVRHRRLWRPIAIAQIYGPGGQLLTQGAWAPFLFVLCSKKLDHFCLNWILKNSVYLHGFIEVGPGFLSTALLVPPKYLVTAPILPGIEMGVHPSQEAFGGIFGTGLGGSDGYGDMKLFSLEG